MGTTPDSGPASNCFKTEFTQLKPIEIFNPQKGSAFSWTLEGPGHVFVYFFQFIYSVIIVVTICFIFIV